jgi:hypothetical protein
VQVTTQETKAFLVIMALISAAWLVPTYAQGYERGWYTLFHRLHCDVGENKDGGCFCNNPNACDITFTTNPRINEWILLDIIKSQGNGHFIPSNLQSTFDDISSDIQTGNFDKPLTQCMSIESNAVSNIDLGCSRLAGIVSSDNNVNADDVSQTNGLDTGISPVPSHNSDTDNRSY